MNDDLTSTCAVFLPKDPSDPKGKLSVFHRYYLPQANIRAKEEENRVPYQHWADEGWLTLTPGEIIDTQSIRADIVAFCKRFRVEKIVLDPRYARELSVQLVEEDRLPVEHFSQTGWMMGEAMKAMERAILGGRVEHEGNPITRWHMSNVQVKFDESGNPRPLKSDGGRSRFGVRRFKIDGIVAMAMPGYMALTDPAMKRKPSYRGRGLRSVRVRRA